MKKTVQFIWLCLFGCLSLASAAQERVYTVGVANFQANLSMAAQLNPILKWVSNRAGVELVMKSGYNFAEMQRHLARGEYDFYIGFPAFQPDIRQNLGYRVIASAAGSAKSAIVVQANAPYQRLSDLAGQEVVMGRPGIFIANILPSAALMEQGISVVQRSAGNQESLVVEFKLERFQAIAVNFGAFKRLIGDHPYRVLWESPPILNYPLQVRRHTVSDEVADRVRQAFLDIAQDPEGKEILQRVNQRPGIQWSGWTVASDNDYRFAIQAYERLSTINTGMRN